MFPPLVPDVFLLTMNARIVHTRIMYAAIVARKATHAKHAVLKEVAHMHALALSLAVAREVVKVIKAPAIVPTPRNPAGKTAAVAVREPKLKPKPRDMITCLRLPN